MGNTQRWAGSLILLLIGISTLLWADFIKSLCLDCIGCYGVVFGAICLADDWIKVRYKDNAGFTCT